MNKEQITSFFKQICQNNDMHAYNELFRLLSGRLVSFAFPIVASAELAEEIVSDVFIMLWQKRSNLSHVQHPLTYLYTCTRNLSLNYQQQQKKYQHTSLDKVEEQFMAYPSDIENKLLSAEVSQQIEQAIRNLPGRCQLIFRLIKVDGLSYKEVAGILNISPKTVDAQLIIAIKKISAALLNNIPEEVAQSYLQLGH